MLFVAQIFHQIIMNIETYKKVPDLFGLPPLTGHREKQRVFERARGQYLDEISRCDTAKKKQFELEYPRDQKFDKGKLAQSWVYGISKSKM